MQTAVEGVGRMFAHEDSIEIKDEVWPLVDTVEQIVLPPSMAAMVALGELFGLWSELPDDMTVGEARTAYVRRCGERGAARVGVAAAASAFGAHRQEPDPKLC